MILGYQFWKYRIEQDFVAVMDEAKVLLLELLGLEGRDTKHFFLWRC
jgi:hypothetical protein